MSGILALLRHGRTALNQENRFSGACDVDLTEIGRKEVAANGETFRFKGIIFTKLFSSSLIRAEQSNRIFLETTGQAHLVGSTIYSDDLRGRNEGVLTGKSRPEAYSEHGEGLVKAWLKSYDQAPPDGESRREMFEQRVQPFYEKSIKPALDQGEQVLVTSHHSTIRALFRASGHGTLEQSDDLLVENGSVLLLEHLG